MCSSDLGPAPEAAIGRDIIRRGAIVAPLFIGLSALGWGSHGAVSAAYGLALVLANYALAAWLVSYTAKISYALMMGMTLFGYIVRLAIIAAAVFGRLMRTRAPFAAALVASALGAGLGALVGERLPIELLPVGGVAWPAPLVGALLAERFAARISSGWERGRRP